MSLLDEIARGGRTSALDVAKSRSLGMKDSLSIQSTRQSMQSATQNMQAKSMEMQEFTNQQMIKTNTRDIMAEADVSTIKGTRQAAEDVFGAGNNELGMKLLNSANLEQERANKVYLSNNKLKGKGLDFKSPEGKKFGDMFTILNGMEDSPAKTNMLEVLNNSIDQKQRADESKATDKMSKTADSIATSSLGLDLEDMDNEDFNLLASTANTLLQGGKNIHQSRSHISKYYEETSKFGRNNRVELKDSWKEKVDVLLDPKTGRSFYADGNTFVGWVD